MGVNHHFSGKSVQRWGTINEKQKKEAFVEVRLMKNAENKASYPYDERKTRKITLRRDTMNKKAAKINFPSRGKTRIQRKSTFPHEGKEGNSEKRISPARENQKSAEDTFPKLGRRENVENRISQTWEEQKTEENGCPNIGKTEKRRKNAFPNLGRIKNLKSCISQPLEEQKIPLRTFPTPRTGCFFCFSFIQPLGRAIFLFFIHPTP